MQHHDRPRLRVRALGPIAATGGAFLLIAFMLLTLAQAGRMLPGINIAGVEIGGLDAWSARRALAPALAREELRPIGVGIPGERIVVRRNELGLRLDVEASVEAALSHGRTGPTRVIARVAAPLRRTTVPVQGQVDEDALAAWVAGLAERIEREASPGDLAIDRATLDVSIIAPSGSVTIDREASIRMLRAALLDPEATRVTLVTSVTLPPRTRPALEALATVAERSLAAPLVLHHEGRRLTIPPTTLAELLSVRTIVDDEGPETTLTIEDDVARGLLADIGSRTFDRDATDAYIGTPALPASSMSELSSARSTPLEVEVTVHPGERRTTFDARRTADQIVTMVLEGRRVAEADLLVLEPRLTTAAAKAGRPTHLLGSFTTFHPAGTARTENIRRLADLLDETLIWPGEEFSINRTSGPRRCDDGYVPAGTIIRGELVDTCGGGVSQVATTLMNAAFFAGLPLEQWQPHSFFIARYPAGREATLSYPDLDVRFRNDTGGFVVLRTSHTPDSITVSLYGVPRWSEVRAEHGERRAPTDFTELIRRTTDLPPGVRRVVQPGGAGFTIDVTRLRTPLDTEPQADVTRERWTTVYRPQQRIVEVGATPLSSDGGPVAASPRAADDGVTAE